MKRKFKTYVHCPSGNNAFGGIHSLYEMVDALNKNGFESYIIHDRSDFRCTWFENETKIIYVPALKNIQELLKPTKDDIFVFTEIHWKIILPFSSRFRNVLLNLGVYMTFIQSDFRNPDDFKSIPYLSERLEAVLVNSLNSKKYLEFAFEGLKSKLYHYRKGINTKLFNYAGKKLKLISFMSRKCPEDINQIINILNIRGNLKGFIFFEINNFSYSQVADTFKASMIFLSTNWQEGFGLPPLEAMSCGCVVIGYTGQGGNEYFKSDFSFPVPAGDIITFAKTIEDVIDLYEQSPDKVIDMGKKASDFVLHNYTPEKYEKDIASIWNNF
jgi:glycosyltransferase involved in cell wall biosynthesis